MKALGATRWTLLDAAREGDQDSCAELVRLYRKPVVRFLHALGARGEAEDLAQEVFLRLFQGLLEEADPEAGRFRSLLCAVSRNVLRAHRTRAQAKKRGGDRAQVPLDEQRIPAEEQSRFDREWLLALLEGAIEELAAEHPRYHQALVRHLAGAGHEQIAAELGGSNKDVRNWLHRARKALGRSLRAAAWSYSKNPADHATELNFLQSLLPPGPGEGER